MAGKSASISDHRAGRTAVAAWGIVLLSLVVLAVHCRHYMPFLADDALISLRYANRLLAGHGLTWTDGRPVEGYSNLLWVLLTASAGRLGIDLVAAVRILGFACGGLLIGAIAYGYRPTTPQKSLPMIVGLSAVVLAGPIAVWTIGGLETMLAAGLLAWAMVLCYPVLEQADPPRKHALAASAFLGLLCITRPDGALFTAAAVVAVLLVKGIRRKTFRTALLLATLPAVLYLGQLAFRLAYYGEWVPNTAYAKISPSSQHLVRGMAYLKNGFFSLSPLSAIAVAAVVLLLLQRRDQPARAKMVLLTVPAVAWSAYVAAIGGDTFPGWRHMVPLIVLMALLLALGTQWVMQRGRVRLAWALAWAHLAVVALATYGYLQFVDGCNRRAVIERWEWDGRVVGLMLKRGFGDRRPLLACNACGCLPYWSELPAIDMLGLNDYHIARNRPERFGQGALAHELGDGRYVLERRPDLVILAGPRGRQKGRFPSGTQMQKDPEFYRLYTLVRFRGREDYPADPVESLIWVRRLSQKIGIRESASRVTVPGYLMAGNTDGAAYLDETERFVVALSPGRPAGVENLRLPPGIWRVEVDSSAGVDVVVRRAGQAAVLAHARAPTEFEHRPTGDAPPSVDVFLEPSAGDDGNCVEVRKLVFVRHKAATAGRALGSATNGRGFMR